MNTGVRLRVARALRDKVQDLKRPEIQKKKRRVRKFEERTKTKYGKNEAPLRDTHNADANEKDAVRRRGSTYKLGP